MFYVIGAFVFSLLISCLILPNILFISHKKKLYDTPDVRKKHTAPVSRLGGLCFYPVIFIVMSGCVVYSLLAGDNLMQISKELNLVQLFALCIGGISLYLIGVKDDLIGVDYKSKFVAQIFAGSLLSISGLWISSLGGIDFLSSLSPLVGIPLSIFLCVYITNAFNLIDGIDGLASGLAILALITMGLLFLAEQVFVYAILAFSGVGCLVPFFWVNVRRSPGNQNKLFMGDTGSLTLGYLLSFLFLILCVNTITFTPLDFRYHYIAFGALIIPLFDVVRVVLVRLRHRKPPFLPDRNHIHHKLMQTGLNDTQVMVFLLFFSIFFIFCNYLLTGLLYGCVVFFIDLGIWFVFHGILNQIIKNKTRENVNPNDLQASIQISKNKQ